MQDKRELIVLALGGNALLDSKSKGTIEEREAAATQTAKQLLNILKSEYDVVLTHGNGPQVGNILIQNEEAASKVPPMPLDVCVAETQGEIGYILQKAIKNEFDRNNITRSILTILTEVMVDENDNAFKVYSKPVGPYYSEFQKNEILKTKSFWRFAKDPAGKGFRRVVPSPKPLKILQTNSIIDLIKSDYLVISVGGGGIPVYFCHNDNEIKGVEAVIDKDLASARLAIDIRADKLIILTNVDACYINFKQENQIELREMNLDEANTYYDQGHFSAGSMGPKIQAAIDFVTATGKNAIISSIEKLEDSLQNKSGTLIHP
jgi:carbamate kinase